MEKSETRLQNKHKPKNKIKIESQLSSEQKIQKCSNHEKRGSVVGYGGKDTQSATEKSQLSVNPTFWGLTPTKSQLSVIGVDTDGAEPPL